MSSALMRILTAVYHNDGFMLDAMLPEFKAANAELQKALKLNDKSGAINYTLFDGLNKALKANDKEKAAEWLKKIQSKFPEAHRVIEGDARDAKARLAQSVSESGKIKADKATMKATAPLFDKCKTIAESIRTNAKNGSKLTAIADKLKAYGDISTRANKCIQLAAAGKDASKQVDMLVKAIDAAKKKFDKAQAELVKNEEKAKRALEILKERSKILNQKDLALGKLELVVGNIIRALPGTSSRAVRGKGNSEGGDAKEKALAFINSKIAPLEKEYKTKLDNAINKWLSECTRRYEEIHTACKDSEKKMREYAEEIGAIDSSIARKIHVAANGFKYDMPTDQVREMVKKAYTDAIESKRKDELIPVFKKMVSFAKGAMEEKTALKKKFRNDRLIEPYRAEYMSREDLEQSAGAAVMEEFKKKAGALQEQLAKIIPIRPVRLIGLDTLSRDLTKRVNDFGKAAPEIHP